MSLLFVGSSSQYAYVDLGAQPTTPLVLGFKMKISNVNTSPGFVGFYRAAGFTGYTGYHVRADDIATPPMQADSANDPTYDVSVKTGIVANQWQTVIAVWGASDANRQIFLDDAAGNLNSSGVFPTLSLRFLIGAYWFSGVAGGYLNGRLAEVFQLNAAPSAGERTAFHNGSKPSDIWTSSLVRYWPFTSNMTDIVLSTALTGVNSPTIDGDHPTMITLGGVAVARRRR